LDDFNPTSAARAIEEFVDAHLSNWYVRLSRKRFWHGELSTDKQAAYQTLHECLLTVAQLASPFAPFFCDWLYRNLTESARLAATNSSRELAESVHLSFIVTANASLIDEELESRMDFAQKISSMVLSIRKKENLRVRQPLRAIRIPVLHARDQERIDSVKEIILAETNVKQLELVDESQARIVKNLKLNFKTLGKKCGKHMKAVQAFALSNGEEIIRAIETDGTFSMHIEGEAMELIAEDVEIIPVDIPGWKVANDGALTVALDITLDDELRNEGVAREIVNRIQNLRKEAGFEVTDRINVKILSSIAIQEAVASNSEYIRTQILADALELMETLIDGYEVEIEEGKPTKIALFKLN
jgi:isoleucyl-tRNA synthetase